METVLSLAEGIGPRPAGSPEEHEAADYLCSRLAAAGRVVERRAFTFRGWRALGHASLWVQADQVGEIPAVAFPYTDATGPSGISGALRWEGLWPVIPGRLACPRFTITDSSGAAVAAVLGSPFGAARPLPNAQPLLRLPTVVIAADEAGRLRELLTSGGKAPRAKALVPAVWQGPLGSENLVIDDAGIGAKLLLIAHYDSVEESPGANDNASGVALLLRLAERLEGGENGLPLLRFLFCGAEEPFLVGSRAYAADATTAGRLEEVAACLNFDMLAVGDSFLIRRQEGSIWERAVELLERESGGGLPVAQAGAVASSDHWALHELGVPSAQLTRITDPAWHSPADQAQRFSSTELDEAEAVALRLIAVAQVALGERTQHGGAVNV